MRHRTSLLAGQPARARSLLRGLLGRERLEEEMGVRTEEDLFRPGLSRSEALAVGIRDTLRSDR